MTHYRMLDRDPSVVITSNRNELKLYKGNVVYLNDGDNFELRFFNPLPQKIGVEIIFNGIRKGDGYLVLNPGQDIILDRFLDEQRKMIFETYVIDGNNKDAVEAIQQNGVINFNFYKEIQYSHFCYDYDYNVNYNFPPKPYKPHKPLYNVGNPWAQTTYTQTTSTYTSYPVGAQVASGASGASGFSGSGGSGGGTKLSKRSKNSTLQTPGVYASVPDQSFSNSNNVFMNECYNPLETGRIEKGEISNQTLRNMNANFASNPFHSISYKIMPYSAMNQTIGEIRQYCPQCSYRIRKDSWLFCPKCGCKLH